MLVSTSYVQKYSHDDYKEIHHVNKSLQSKYELKILRFIIFLQQ